MSRPETPHHESLNGDQRGAMSYLLGPSGFERWDKGIMPLEFTPPLGITTILPVLRRRSLESGREWGVQFVWDRGTSALVRTLDHSGTEEETYTQSKIKEWQLRTTQTPVVDLHTHPATFNKENPNNYARNQFPSQEDIDILSQEHHILASIVAGEQGYSCVLKQAQFLEGTLSLPETPPYSRIDEVANNAKLEVVGNQLAIHVGTAFGVYHTFSSASYDFRYIARKNRSNRSHQRA